MDPQRDAARQLQIASRRDLVQGKMVCVCGPTGAPRSKETASPLGPPEGPRLSSTVGS